MKEATPQIDLQEIEKIYHTITGRLEIERVAEVQDLHFPLRFSLDTAEKIADALEALPKLIFVLEQIVSAPQPFNALEYGSFVETAKRLTSEALSLIQSPKTTTA